MIWYDLWYDMTWHDIWYEIYDEIYMIYDMICDRMWCDAIKYVFVVIDGCIILCPLNPKIN